MVIAMLWWNLPLRLGTTGNKNSEKYLKFIGYWMKSNAKGQVNVKGTCLQVQ